MYGWRTFRCSARLIIDSTNIAKAENTVYVLERLLKVKPKYRAIKH